MIKIALNELRSGWLGEEGATLRLSVNHNKGLKEGGFIIENNSIEAGSESGLLYGAYELLRRQRSGLSARLRSNPSYSFRILNHWDNLNGTVERGYAGRSIFWSGAKDLTPTPADLTRWKDYARACASVGINGSVLNNVNASPQMLSPQFLKRVRAIAEVLRPYGIKVYLSVNFSSPSVLGGLSNADPLSQKVVAWWRSKVAELYRTVPDFGGFLVKANSEGQPGPQDFGRTHADGANMLADILRPYQGIVMWRAFVYSSTDRDRARQAYSEFKPLDGKFRDNVIIQVKNGPIDFQPREPFSPLFGAMKKTAVMPELQITQEYLGHSKQLAFLAPMWEEFLESETWQEGAGSTVARCTDGSVFPRKFSAIAGVANIGSDSNWCGNTFAQANWYAFGRLAWDHSLSSSQIVEEWLRLTFDETADYAGRSWIGAFYNPVKLMMLRSWEAVVNYSMPLGLHHIFSADDHYGPGPWYAPANVRIDWTSPYYHQADSQGIGFDRSRSGSGAVSQYHEPLASGLNDVKTCPEKFLLWFHHLPWDYKLRSGRSLWEEICLHYDQGVKQVSLFQNVWDGVEPFVDAERYTELRFLLQRQARDARVWKDACIQYFQGHSKRPIPAELERPIFDLRFLQSKKPLDLFGDDKE